MRLAGDTMAEVVGLPLVGEIVTFELHSIWMVNGRDQRPDEGLSLFGRTSVGWTPNSRPQCLQ